MNSLAKMQELADRLAANRAKQATLAAKVCEIAFDFEPELEEQGKELVREEREIILEMTTSA